MLATRAATLALIVITPSSGRVSAQAVDDAVLLSPRTLGVSVMHAHESWAQYWEGELKRSNENIGRFTRRRSAAATFAGRTCRSFGTA